MVGGGRASDGRDLSHDRGCLLFCRARADYRRFMGDKEMTREAILAKRANLLSRIAGGERWKADTRREYHILTAALLALEMKEKNK